MIATCAHTLYDGTTFHTDYKVKVYDAAGTTCIATYNATELHIPATYYNGYNKYYDYGLIYVDDDLTDYGTMALGLPTNEFETTEQTVAVSGFPGLVNGISTSNRYYGLGTITTTTNDYRLCYTTYASPGQSGGPVYVEYTLGDETYRSAIGIHSTSAGSNHYAIRTTVPLLRFYYNNSHIG